MAYLDEEFIALKRQEKKAKFSTLETGIYVHEELIQFEQIEIPELRISAVFPKTFVRMPLSIAKIKYPADTRPQIIYTSLDTTVNFTFSVAPQEVPSGQVAKIASQMRAMLKKVNPANIFYDIEEEFGESEHSTRLCWFNYKSYAIDDQIYTIMYLAAVKKGTVLHGTFNCRFEDMNEWHHAALQVIKSVSAMDE